MPSGIFQEMDAAWLIICVHRPRTSLRHDVRRAEANLAAAKAAALDAALASLRAPLHQQPALELAYRRALARECACEAAYTAITKASRPFFQ